MEVILREDIEKLGNRGQIVKVAAGYARNYLLPKRLAVPASDANRKIVEQERQAHLRKEAKLAADAADLGKMMADVAVTIHAKAGAEGVDYFKELVKAGEGVEKQGRKLVGEQVEAANSQFDSVKNSVTGVKEKVEVQFDRIEKAFDNRVASALNRIGIPSRQDVEALSAKLDELSALLEHVARTK